MKDKLYAIVDLETTGGRASRDKITEIAIVLYDGHQILDTFESLINPECYIPYGITQLTGITQEMVEDAPRFFEVAKKVVKLTEGAVFVAHNVRFDYSFLREEFNRLGFTFTRKQLCTVRLSRKAMPFLGRYGLDNLVQHLGIKMTQRHRAMADAMATKEVLEHILRKEEQKENINQLINLGIKESLLPQNIDLETIHNLPEECGVYYFHNTAGEVVYVGKSINIKKRVAEHFAKKTEKARKLQQHVHEITFELTGSELLALLHESQEIKRLRPSINRAQRQRQFPHVVYAYENKAGYICFNHTKVSNKTRKAYQIISEYPKQSHARGHLSRMLKEYELCPRLCHLENGKGACFSYHIKQCHGACAEMESPEEYNERAKAAMERMRTIFDSNFFILDKGRSQEEHSIVLVEDGRYQGHGYIDLEEASNGNGLDNFRDAIQPYHGNAETTRIIQRFLGDNPKVKKIAF